MPRAYLLVYYKLLLVLEEKVFYKVKIKSEIAIFASTLIVWPVYVPNALSPHKLLLIL